MRRLLKNALICMALAAALFTLCACTEDPTISFRFNDSEVDEMRIALNEFEAVNRGVTIELQRIAWTQARHQFLREAAVGEGPDVVHVAIVWPRDMGAAGALLPLNQFLESETTTIKLDDFLGYENAMDEDGNVYGIPWTVDTWAMVYNTDLLAAARIQELPSTWDELRDASRKVHQVTGTTGWGLPGGSASSGSLWFLANFYWWSRGETLLEYDQGCVTSNVSVESVVEAIQYFQSFFDEGHSPAALLGASDWFDPAITEALVDGEQAIAIMPPNTFAEVLHSFRTRFPDKTVPFVTTRVPSKLQYASTHLGGRMLAINANTKDPEMAWRLIEHLTRQDVLSKHYSNQFPAQHSALKSLDIGEEYSGFLDQLGNARGWGAYLDGPASVSEMWNATGRAFGSAFIGEKSLENAAKELLETVAADASCTN